MRANPLTPAQQTLIAVFAGFSLFALVLIGINIGFHLNYTNRIYPGVRVGWVDVTGLTIEEAAAHLAAEYDFSQTGTIVFRDGERVWSATPAELGLFAGPEYNARTAFDLGRAGPIVTRLSGQFNAWYAGVNLPVQMLFDERIATNYLEKLATQIDIPTKEAALVINGTEVVVRAGQIGRTTNIPATIERLNAQLASMLDGEVEIVVEESPPIILDVTEQAEIAERILSRPLVLSLPNAAERDPGPWTFGREELARMLVIERVETEEGATYQVRLSAQLLGNFLKELAPTLYRQRANARFMFNDETQELELIEPSITGQTLDIGATLQKINTEVTAGDHQVNLDMEYTLPEVSSEATATELGITELVSSHTSYFYGSSASRKQNIATAASRFYGVLVAPGETFSMADILGDVSLDTGYAEAWIIFGDRTIKGVGGGVCQVSTTLFRTVFLGGFPIVERHPHAYRVYYYEQTYGGGNDSTWAGLDATVYVPLVDFKFTNDTDYWLLMETYIGDNDLTWKFYSTSDGRTVTWNTTGLQSITDPPDPLYQENAELNKGEIKQVDWAVDGASVTVTRSVERAGTLIDSDIITTNYMPWRAVCEYGPGTEGMPPEDPNPNNPCKPDKD